MFIITQCLFLYGNVWEKNRSYRDLMTLIEGRKKGNKLMNEKNEGKKEKNGGNKTNVRVKLGVRSAVFYMKKMKFG